MKDLTSIQRQIIFDIEQMNERDLIAVKSFISALEEYKKAFNISE